jgi:DNA (cytosine-5)-methyltransferase 1
MLTAIELFAGVGGFRLGLEKNDIKVIWSNQWEPSTKKQHASMVYENVFGKENHINEDINKVDTNDIPDADILCGGFPCQDYSIASTSKHSKGIVGKKGVLWWSIYKILNEKKNKPKYLLLENVDRLLKSPTKQRGRDFAIMLKTLSTLGYNVEWKVISASDYGMPQRRKRTFIFGYHKSAKFNICEETFKEGILSKSFPTEITSNIEAFELEQDVNKISDNFGKDLKLSPFMINGAMIGDKIFTYKTKPIYNGDKTLLKDIIENGKVNDEFYINDEQKPKWEYLKGAKSFDRISKSGHKYKYTEGKMTYPDDLNKPSRTIITSEGGKTPSRFTHVIDTEYGLRRLTPIELERLNMFPDNHTKLDGITNTKRAFFMGNALVVGIVDRIAQNIINI